MNVLGIILILFLPYAAGLIFNIITRQKETNQIETYLIGFFSVFLLQGVVFSAYNFLGLSFDLASKIMTIASWGILIIGLVVGIICYKSFIKPGSLKVTFRKEERVMCLLMLLSFALVILRICMLYKYGRDDIILETVRVNVNTNTINAYNPLTNRPYELGLINSKKLITLPVYYTYLCMTYGINPRVLLYLVCSIQTVICSYFACQSTMFLILKTNKKVYTYSLFMGALILSGDYMKGIMGYRLLWNGYDGTTIVAATILPFIIYLVMFIYRVERGDFGEKKWGKRIVRALQILVCLVSSLFITGIPNGALLIILSLIAIALVCTLRFGREEKEHE